jgi:hypothetical protein
VVLATVKDDIGIFLFPYFANSMSVIKAPHNDGHCNSVPLKTNCIGHLGTTGHNADAKMVFTSADRRATGNPLVGHVEIQRG